MTGRTAEPLDRDTVPRIDFRVRRRRAGDLILLLRNTEWFEIDETADIVWRSCARGASVGESVRAVADETGLPLSEALVATSWALGSFRACGLVEW